MDDKDIGERMDNEPSTSIPDTPDNTVPALRREDTHECAICLQPCMQPVRLPCSHTFCFLCAKGIAIQSHRCALCRTAIPEEFLAKPVLFQAPKDSSSTEGPENDRYVWYYEGHRGWWQYDERACIDIEVAYKNKEKNVELLIAGSLYIIDFENMIQSQRNYQSRKRKIKRDLITADKKGIAGMVVAEQVDNKAGDTDNDMDNPIARQLPLGGGCDANVPSSSNTK